MVYFYIDFLDNILSPSESSETSKEDVVKKKTDSPIDDNVNHASILVENLKQQCEAIARSNKRKGDERIENFVKKLKSDLNKANKPLGAEGGLENEADDLNKQSTSLTTEENNDVQIKVDQGRKSAQILAELEDGELTEAGDNALQKKRGSKATNIVSSEAQQVHDHDSRTSLQYVDVKKTFTRESAFAEEFKSGYNMPFKGVTYYSPPNYSATMNNNTRMQSSSFQIMQNPTTPLNWFKSSSYSRPKSPFVPKNSFQPKQRNNTSVWSRIGNPTTPVNSPPNFISDESKPFKRPFFPQTVSKQKFTNSGQKTEMFKQVYHNCHVAGCEETFGTIPALADHLGIVHHRQVRFFFVCVFGN